MQLLWTIGLAALHGVVSEPTEEDCSEGALRKNRDADQKAWCDALYGQASQPTLGDERRLWGNDQVIQVGGAIYDCRDGLDDVKLYWDVEKQAHCCAELGMGCPQNAFDCESGYMNWVHGWSPGKKIWCCMHSNRGCPPTTETRTSTATTTSTSTYPGCRRTCTLQNVEVTCQERIHFASVHTFLGETSPCQMSHELVLHECGGLCDQCSIREACLGAANVPTTTPPPATRPRTTRPAEGGKADPFDCHEGLDMWQMVWFPAKQEWCCKNRKLGCPDDEAGKAQKWQSALVPQAL
ncbi:unnamed protein product [Effrenium voratum]|uniref:Uncharacterized protein n=1 Tax=Effrenium voratum TaxID=2562239 RepID=A0AA36IJT7_9DINO|nr:unnamed protein product [Effrenium voratum]